MQSPTSQSIEGAHALSTISDVLSIIGFGVTIYVAITVYKVEQTYVRQALVEACLPKLRAALKNIKRAMTRSDEAQLRQELQKCRAVLSHVLRFSKHAAETRNAIAVIERVSLYKGSKLLNGGDETMETIAGEAERLELLTTELHWSRRNG